MVSISFCNGVGSSRRSFQSVSSQSNATKQKSYHPANNAIICCAIYQRSKWLKKYFAGKWINKFEYHFTQHDISLNPIDGNGLTRNWKKTTTTTKNTNEMIIMGNIQLKANKWKHKIEYANEKMMGSLLTTAVSVRGQAKNLPTEQSIAHVYLCCFSARKSVERDFAQRNENWLHTHSLSLSLFSSLPETIYTRSLSAYWLAIWTICWQHSEVCVFLFCSFLTVRLRCKRSCSD